MTVRREGETAWLEGACRVEEAEVLVGLLGAGVRIVDVSRCEALHAAVAQVLLTWRPQLQGAPGESFLRDHLIPALASANSAVAAVATSPSGDAMEQLPSGPGAGGTQGAST